MGREVTVGVGDYGGGGWWEFILVGCYSGGGRLRRWEVGEKWCRVGLGGDVMVVGVIVV